MTTQPDLLDLVESIFQMTEWHFPGPAKPMRPTRNQRLYAMAVAEVLVAGEAQDRVRLRQAKKQLTKAVKKLTAVRFIEGETGLGKTLGYLVPVLLHAALTGKRCGISVYTLDLQNQIWGAEALRAQRQPSVTEGDQSDLAKARYLFTLALPDHKIPYVSFRRGAANYLSVTKSLELLKALPAHLATRADWVAFRARTEQIAAWKPRQKDLFGEDLGFGLLDYIDLPADVTRDQVAIESTQEAHGNPIYKAILADSREGDVVIMTHAMAIANADRWHTLLEHKSDEADGDGEGQRPLSVLVYDEADLLERAAQSFGQRRLDVQIVANRIKKWQEKDMVPDVLRAPLNRFLQHTEQAINWFNGIYKETGGVDRDQREADGEPVEAHRVLLYGPHQAYLDKAVGRIKLLAACLADCETAFPKGAAGRAHPEIRSALTSWTRTMDRLLEAVALQQKQLEKAQAKKAKRDADDAGGESRDATQKDKALYPNTVLVLSWSPARSFPAFEAIEPYPTRRLNRNWATSRDGRYAAHMDSVIFTSATLQSLSPHDPLSDLRLIFGVVDNELTHEILFAAFSPEKFGGLKAVYLAHPSAPNHKPASRSEHTGGSTDDVMLEETAPYRLSTDYLDYVAATIRYIANLGEPALVIPASYLEAKDLAKRLTADDRVFTQTRSGHAILQDGIRRLQKGVVTVLVSPAAGQGTNIRAADGSQLLLHVVVTKLPLPPIDTAREEILAVAHMLNGLPPNQARRAARGAMFGIQRRLGYFVLKQRLGRLIRSASDTGGSLWVLDPRLGLPEGNADFNKDIQKLLGQNTIYAGYFSAFPHRFYDIVRKPILVEPIQQTEGKGKNKKSVITDVRVVPTASHAIVVN